MEPANRYYLLANPRNAPLRGCATALKAFKQKLGYASDDDFPWIFREIPNAPERCTSVSFTSSSIIIEYKKYKYSRLAILNRWREQGKCVEGHFFRDNGDSTKGWFSPISIYRDFKMLEKKRLEIPYEMPAIESLRKALDLNCDEDFYLIPRNFIKRELNQEFDKCFISEIALKYLFLVRDTRRSEFQLEFLSRFYFNVFLGNQAFFYYAYIEGTNQSQLAYVVFSHSLRLMNSLFYYYKNNYPFYQYEEQEKSENLLLPRMNYESSLTDFNCDIDFQEFELVSTRRGLVARRIRPPEEPEVDLEEFNWDDVVDINALAEGREVEYRGNERRRIAMNVYNQCEIFLFKSANRYFFNQTRIPESCQICLGDFEPNDEVKLAACRRHLFHKSCFDGWVEAHHNCPICRYDMSEGLVHDEDEEQMNLLLRKRGRD